MAGTSSRAEGLEEDGLTCKKACPRCTFLNTCRACGAALGDTPNTEIIYVSSSDDDEIECENCTLINKVGAWACVACATQLNASKNETVMDYAAASSSHVYKDSTGTKFACQRCTFLNELSASVCVCCGYGLQVRELMVEESTGAKVACESCTFLNELSASSICVSCGYGLQVRQLMFEDSTRAKLACERCTFLNELSASICVCCGYGLQSRELVIEKQICRDTHQAGCESDEIIVCQACNGNFGSKSSGHKLINCDHGFCRPCLSTVVVERLLDLMQAEGTDEVLCKYDRMMQCPVEGCGRTLSRQDLRLVVGPSIQGMLDQWLMASLNDHVVCPLIRCCPNCKDMQRQLLIPPHHFHLLHRKSLRKAFQCNGLDLPSQRHSRSSVLVQQLKNAAPFSLLCSCCFLLVCQDCGLKSAPSTGMAHRCDPLRRQSFDVTRSIMKLCFAYIQATHVCEKRRSKKKARTCAGFFFPGNNGSNQPMQIQEGNGYQEGNGLIFEGLVKWFSGKDFEDMSKIQGTAAQGQKIADEDSNEASSHKTKASVVDNLAQTALQELTSFILQVMNDNRGALSPLVAALLCAHDLPYTLLKWLMRNDSLMDIKDHAGLYQTVLGFMRAVSSSWDLLPLLCSREAKHDCFAMQSRWETPGSVMSDFEKLYRQAQFMLRRGEHLLLCDNQGAKKKHLDDSCLLLSSLVADVVTTYEMVHKRMMVWEEKTLQNPWLDNNDKVSRKDEHHKAQLLYAQLKKSISKQFVHSSSPTDGAVLDSCELDEQSSAGEDDEMAERGEDASTEPSAALVEAYKKVLRPLQFDEACLLPSHYFRYLAAKNEALVLNKRRARAISEELMQLNTILPLEWESSIFVRMDDHRSDVLRALIIGPEGTPYENGVFLFDLLLEMGYPDTPPKVQFLTTGGGMVRFNPNLYQCGTVCLSLLGTWRGPGWTVGQSSILQVLVSIQGLIFVADPYYNEPGFESKVNPHAANAYLRHQRLNTVLYSMLPALRCPDPLFLPVIRTHFRLKAPHILRQCTAWAHGESYQFKSSIDQLRLELDKLTGIKASSAIV